MTEPAYLRPPTHRSCTGCSRWLPLEDFPANRHMHLGVSSHCRECHRRATQDWRERNPDYLENYNAERRARYRAKHPRSARPCVVCGENFSGRPDALVCSERCRNRRRRELRRLREAAA